MLRAAQWLGYVVLCGALGALFLQPTLRSRLVAAADEAVLGDQLAQIAELGTHAWDIACLEMSARARPEPSASPPTAMDLLATFVAPDGVVDGRVAGGPSGLWDGRPIRRDGVDSTAFERTCLDLRSVGSAVDRWRVSCAVEKVAWVVRECYGSSSFDPATIPARIDAMDQLSAAAHVRPAASITAAAARLRAEAGQMAHAKDRVLRTADAYFGAWIQWVDGLVDWSVRPSPSSLEAAAGDLAAAMSAYETSAGRFIALADGVAAACRAHGRHCKALPPRPGERFRSWLLALESARVATLADVQRCAPSSEPIQPPGMSREMFDTIRRQPLAQRRRMIALELIPEERLATDDSLHPQPPLRSRFRELESRTQDLERMRQERPWHSLQLGLATLCPSATVEVNAGG